MRRTRVKICGLTSVDDVAAACEAGADAVGFVCYERSARHVAPPLLAKLAPAVSPFVTPVLLFVDAQPDEVHAALEIVPAALLQFHGREDPRQCGLYRRPYIKAVAMSAGVDLLDFEARFEGALALLADAPAFAAGAATAGLPAEAPAGGEGKFGGAGVSFDWTRIAPASRRRKPLVLAGGLRPDNVAAAITAVAPDAVDVSSGVEQARGIKSAERIRAFIAAVRAADQARGNL